MSEYRVSKAATSDLEGIWLYVAEDNPDAADKLIKGILSRFPKLAAMPYMGRRREELSPGLRSFPIASYVIFYRPMEGGVEIVRILHGARDFPPLFE